MRGPARHLQRARGGQEVGIRVLGADAGLNGVAAHGQLLLSQRQRLPGGHAQLPLHQVLPGDGLGDRMLHLQPGVHLHEVEAPILVAALLDDEFHRAGAHVTDGLRRRYRRRAHLGATLRRHARGGGFFQHLLVAALDGAVALEEVDRTAQAVAEHLDLDVARARDVALYQHMVITKAGLGLALAAGQRGGEVFRALHAPHALATTAGAGLDEHGVADAVGLALQQRGVVVLPVVARHQRHASLLHQGLGRGLAAHVADGRGRRADEDQPGVSTGLGEVFVLGQEAVARVHRLRPGGLGRFQDALPAQVAVARRAGTDVHRLVAGANMAGLGIGVGVHRHRADAQAPRSGGDAAGDLAAVGNQYLLEHRFSAARSPFAALTATPARACSGRPAHPPGLRRWRGCRQCAARSRREGRG